MNVAILVINTPMDDLLERYAVDVRPLSALESLRNGGGLSGARLWRFSAARGPLVLRAWPAHGPGRSQLEQMHRWRVAAADLDFVPVPIGDQAGISLQDWRGSLWEMTPWLSGTPDLACPPGLDRLRLAFTGLARLHEHLVHERREDRSLGLRNRRDTIAALLCGGFDTLQAAIDRGGPAGAARANAHAWLALARRLGPILIEPLERAADRVVRVQPCVRDVRPEHFLFEEDRLSGLVDYGAMGVDSVAGDLARLLGEWCDGDSAARREAVDAYKCIRSLDPAEERLINLFESATALLIGERWTRWNFIEHRFFDDPDAAAKGIERSLSQMRRLDELGIASGLAQFLGGAGE